ncbi:MAG TPA: sigma-54 dependent transcriptional regulator [Thermoanaerobaculia bacterium]|nr:sigma-54 dependent transcriptional regulator [Thermoanaerobaculia bacterium]
MDTAHKPRILIADDQREVREALRLMLKTEGFDTETAGSPAEILQAVTSRDFDAVLMDLNYTRDTTSGREGLDLLARLRALEPTLPVVVMTAWASVDVAVEAMRRGARDFVEKPWDNNRLNNILRNQIDLHRALRRGQRLAAENEILRADGEPILIARSPEMHPVLDLIERIGPSEANVLITGENGTGKGVVARALHAASARAEIPMVTVNTGGLSEALFESELFGHVRGAFTDAKTDRVGRFELADGGTLFLDEIANISLNQQAKLLRVLETGEFERLGSSKTRAADVRIVSATNADLREEVAAGRFRQDLLFRLNTVEIRIPALRERRDDIVPLAQHFLVQHAQRYRKQLTGFEEAAAALLLSHPWPGNVRELGNTLRRAAIWSDGASISSEDVREALLPVVTTTRPEVLGRPLGGGLNLRDLLKEVARHYLERAMDEAQGNKTKAAELVGLPSYQTLTNWLKTYEVQG